MSHLRAWFLAAARADLEQIHEELRSKGEDDGVRSATIMREVYPGRRGTVTRRQAYVHDGHPAELRWRDRAHRLTIGSLTSM